MKSHDARGQGRMRAPGQEEIIRGFLIKTPTFLGGLQKERERCDMQQRDAPGRGEWGQRFSYLAPLAPCGVAEGEGTLRYAATGCTRAGENGGRGFLI